MAVLLMAGCSAEGLSSPAGADTYPFASAAAPCTAALAQCKGQFVAHDTRHFTVHAADAGQAQRMSDILELVYDRFYESLVNQGFSPVAAGEPMVWVFFDDRADYDHYAALVDRMEQPAPGSYYSARTNRVAVARLPSRSCGPTAQVPGLSRGPAGGPGVSSSTGGWNFARVTHEAAHQIAFNSGIQKRGVMYPLWACEGLATNFEALPNGTLEFGGDNPSRRRQLVEARDAGHLLPLRQFLTVAHPGPQYDMCDLYAQSWGLFRFLLQCHRQDLKYYFITVRDLPVGPRGDSALRQEFIEAFGPVEPLEQEWKDYVRAMGKN